MATIVRSILYAANLFHHKDFLLKRGGYGMPEWYLLSKKGKLSIMKLKRKVMLKCLRMDRVPWRNRPNAISGH